MLQVLFHNSSTVLHLSDSAALDGWIPVKQNFVTISNDLCKGRLSCGLTCPQICSVDMFAGGYEHIQLLRVSVDGEPLNIYRWPYEDVSCPGDGTSEVHGENSHSLSHCRDSPEDMSLRQRLLSCCSQYRPSSTFYRDYLSAWWKPHGYHLPQSPQKEHPHCGRSSLLSPGDSPIPGVFGLQGEAAVDVGGSDSSECSSGWAGSYKLPHLLLRWKLPYFSPLLQPLSH